MLTTLVLTIPMALLWMIFAGQLSFEGFVVGYIFGFAILMLVRSNTSFDEDGEPTRITRIPSQIFALIVYVFKLSFDVLLSGIDVAVKVLQPNMPIEPGTYTISTQDDTNNAVVSALSAHSITITPGELVIDFNEDDDGNTTMLVHTLDKNASKLEKLETDQQERLGLIQRILGLDVTKKER